jgi:hypothetical protein
MARQGRVLGRALPLLSLRADAKDAHEGPRHPPSAGRFQLSSQPRSSLSVLQFPQAGPDNLRVVLQAGGVTDEKRNGDRRQAWTLRVPKWKDFQHYSNREPPWIKLYRSLLDKPEWRRLSGWAAKLLVDVWMLAAQQKGGFVTLRLDDLSYRVRSPAARTARSLLELRGADLLALSDNMLAECEHLAPESRPETEAERETETQETNTKSVPNGTARLQQ